MKKHAKLAELILLNLLALSPVATAAGAVVPKPFQGYDNDAEYSIDYSDLTALLKIAVVDLGRSDRRVAEPAPDITGTRLKVRLTRTANEANRFYFETFLDNEEAIVFLRDIQTSLEELPGKVPLKHFSRDEQLAYWLNLYNVTVLNQVIAKYPISNLKKLVSGNDSIFAEKLLTVAGVPLSLHDIQFNILRHNYNNNPLIMYGLYQGIIGGPDIRRTAYAGRNVWNALEDNALGFINSNRGTYIKDDKIFRVSSLYGRNEAYFPDFGADLSSHLVTFLDNNERLALQAASEIKPDINDWTVTDLGGAYQRFGGSLADNRAALMDSVKSSIGGVTNAATSSGASALTSKGMQASMSRVNPGLLAVLHGLNDKRLIENKRKSKVEIEDFVGVPPESDSEPDTRQEN